MFSFINKHAVGNSENYEHYRKFLSMMMEVSMDFIKADINNFDEIFNLVLEKIGIFLKADRTFIFELSNNDKYMSNTYEWCNFGIPPFKESLQQFKVSDFPMVENLLITKEILYIPDADLLPVENNAEKEEMKRQGIQSILCLPIIKANKVLGYFGFDSVRTKRYLDEEEVAITKVIGILLADAIEKNRMEKEKKIADEALKISEEKYRNFFNYVQDAIFEANIDGILTDISPAIEIITKGQYKREELIGHAIVEFSADVNIRNHYRELLFKYGKVSDMEFPIKNKDGSIIHISATSLLKLDSSGRPEKIYGTLRDISDRIKANEELNQTKQTYLDIFNSLTEAVYIQDENGTFIDVNEGAAKLYLTTRDKLIGQNPLMVAAPGKNNLEETQKLSLEVFNSGKTTHIDFWSQRTNGEIFPKELIVNKGKYFGKDVLIATGRDVTEKKKNELALKESEKRFRMLANDLPALVCEYLPDSTLIFVNQAYCDFMNIAKEEIINRKYYDIIPDTDKDEIIEIIGKISVDNPVLIHTMPIKLKNQTKLFEWRNRAVINENGEIELIRAIGIDLTDRIRAEESLKESERLLRELNNTKDKFFSIIAHDLKNPLGSFKNLTQMLHKDYDLFDETERKETLEMINKSAKNVYGLLENLLEWSRTQRGLIPFSPVDANLFMVADSCISLLLPTANNKNIRLINNIPINTYHIFDPNLVTTIIRNLISNSIKFTPENGEISINLDYDAEENSLVIAVADNGVGMNDKIKNKLFKIDEHQTSAGTSGEKGTGLGLLLCKEFVEMHNGRIWVESEIGKGSIFYFSLP